MAMIASTNNISKSTSIYFGGEKIYPHSYSATTPTDNFLRIEGGQGW
jgi:hypothetical protein